MFFPASMAAVALWAYSADLPELRGQTTTMSVPSRTPAMASIGAGGAPQGGGSSAPVGNLRARVAQTAAQSGARGRGYGLSGGYGNGPVFGNFAPQASMASPMFPGNSPSGQTGLNLVSAAPAYSSLSPAAIQITNTTPVAGRLPTTVTLGFAAPSAASSEVANTIAKRLSSLPSLHFLTPVQVEVVGRTAILRGRIATEHERELAEHVLLLEAAIDRVENFLVVGDGKLPTPPAPAAGPTPPPKPPAPTAGSSLPMPPQPHG